MDEGMEIMEAINRNFSFFDRDEIRVFCCNFTSS